MKSMDPLLAARAFAGMVVHQGMIFAIYDPGHMPPGGRVEVVSTVVNIFLGGIQA
jgi:hypothetical protein